VQRVSAAPRPLAASALCAAVLMLGAAAFAAEAPGLGCPPDNAIAFQGFTARLENDLFFDTDRDYTSGLSLTAISRDLPGEVDPACLPPPLGLHTALIERFDPGFWRSGGDILRAQNVAVKIGQSMFTPADARRTDLIVNDRPYAGLLYVGLAWNRRSVAPASNLEKLDTREITLGLIGPLSLARQSQDLVHNLRGFDRFRGWRHQLRTEPALQLVREQKTRDYRGPVTAIPGFAADAIRSFGLSLGNIETSAYAGWAARVGWNVPNDFGTYPIRPAAENRPPSPAWPRAETRPGGAATVQQPGAHLFAALEAKLVAYDFSLDGNLFRSSHSVKRRPLVVQAALGLSVHAVIAGRGVRLALMRVTRSREFAGQDGAHTFGSVALSVDF
jgi:hypothetical protein